MMKKPVDYKQYDLKWAFVDYSATGEINTIKSAGCGITCSAMVIASLKDKTVTPVITAKWSKNRGYKIKSQGTAYSYFKPQLAEYKINCTMLNGSNVYHNKSASVHKTALDELKSGNWVIAVMGVGRWTKGGHYVLCYAYDDGYVYINDPASTKEDRLKAKLEDWQYEVKYYWKIEIPSDKKIELDKPVVVKPVPKKSIVYVVKSGDTLGEIADTYGTTVENLVKLNKIKKANMIKIGQKIKIR